MGAELPGGGAIPYQVSHPDPPKTVSPSTPAKHPAPAKPQPTPAEQDAWNTAVANATAASPRPRAWVISGETLTSLAGKYGESVPTIERDNLQITPPYLIFPGEKIYLTKQKPAEVVPPIPDSQIKPIFYAVGDASLYDQTSAQQLQQHPSKVTADDDQAVSNANWDVVGQRIYDMLVNNNHTLFPNKAAAEEVKELEALIPHNAPFAATFDTKAGAALTAADQLWTKTGIIAYSNYVKTGTQQAKDDFLATIDQSFAGAAGHAGSLGAVITAVDHQASYIEGLGPQGSQGQAFTNAVNSAALNFEAGWAAGQVASAYKTGGALAAANTLKALTRAAAGSSLAADIIQKSAGTIDSITKQMGLLASSTGEPSRSWQNGFPPSVQEFRQIYTDLSQAVTAADTITVSVNPHTGATSVSLSPDGKKAAQTVAGLIAQNTPANLQPYQQEFLYAGAADETVGSGAGAALSVATAAALNQRHDTSLASLMAGSITDGLGGLASKTSTDFSNFEGTTAGLYALRGTWGPFMSNNGLVTATNDYLAAHKNDVGDKADAELAALSQDGDAIAEAEAAWTAFGQGKSAPLDGIAGFGDLSKAVKALTGNSGAAAFAVSQSPSMNQAIATAFLHTISSNVQSNGQSLLQELLTSPAWSLPRSLRSALNAYYKYTNNQIKLQKAVGENPDKASVSDNTLLALSTIGFLLTADNAYAKKLWTGGAWGTPVSLEGFTSNVYTVLGFPKYGAEIMSGLAKNSVLTKFTGALPFPNLTGPALSNPADTKLMAALKTIQTDMKGWTKTFLIKKIIGPSYYGAGALAALLESIDDFSNNDPVSGGLNLAEASGNALNAAKPFIEAGIKNRTLPPQLLDLLGLNKAQAGAVEQAIAKLGPDATPEDIAAASDGASSAATDALAEAIGEGISVVGSGIGLLAAAGVLVWQSYQSQEAQLAFQGDNAKFLVDGLGLNPALANEMSSGPVPGSPFGSVPPATVASALQSYADAYFQGNGQLLLQRLNQEPVDKAIQFIDQAANMPATAPGGGYEMAVPGDGPAHTGDHKVLMHSRRGGPGVWFNVPYQADSLEQLNYWAQYLFGPKGLNPPPYSGARN